MIMRKILSFKTGQAIVEFALAATLIFFLLAAAVDLGLIFFTVQGLHNAAQEGAAFGSRWLQVGTDTNGDQIRVLDFNGIRERVRKESGSKGGIGFVNLLDLNNDGTRDVGPNDNAVVGAAGTTYQKMPNNSNVIDNFIQIQLLADTDTDGDPMNDLVGGQPTPCADPSSSRVPCFIRVTVSYNYKTVFPLTPGFARTTTLRSSYILRIRDTFSEGGEAPTPPVFVPATATPSPTPCPSVNAPSLSRTKSGTSVTLTWTAVTGANQYEVYQATGSSPSAGSYSLSNTVNAPITSVTDGLSGTSGTVNWYYVVAINNCGDPGPASNKVSITK
jgi:hypothetical protein